ncbi:Tenascin [Thelohanellus kitauei]|uniref:Tenascin n=1 Tax=Thelohanellus kitauei TaxID=669202 RepID=A0A0C2N876_THEKT|nr:Tenascin [Thelohanellus kitauei]
MSEYMLQFIGNALALKRMHNRAGRNISEIKVIQIATIKVIKFVENVKNKTADDINNVECNNDQKCGEYGKCICGKCQCQNVLMKITKSPELFYGLGCSCSDQICPFTKKGQCICFCTCECGKCKCNTDYKGIDCSELVCDHPTMMNKCKETEGAEDCSGKATCVCGTCTCPYEYSGTYCETLTVPTVRCSDISKCMVKVYDSNEHVGCNIPVTLVEKLDESTSYFALSCQMIHQNCLRSFMIHINNNVKHIDRITLKRLDPQQDCLKIPIFISEKDL